MVIDWNTTLLVLCAISTFGFTAFVLLFFFGSRGAIRFDAKDVPALPERARPGVTILKPCAGNDDDLEECLESYFRLNYPTYQLVFGVRDASDAAYPVIQRLIAKHPERDAVLVQTQGGRLPNPKVAQLEVMGTRAKHAIFWIADSNTLVHPDTLASMVDQLEEPGVGMVVSPVQGVHERTKGGVLENLQIAAHVMITVYAVYGLTKIMSAPGKSMLFRREALESAGGFAELGRYCAEDFLFCEALRAQKQRVVLGRFMIGNVNASPSIQRFLDRHLRWTQLRWLVAVTTFAEPLISPMVPSLLLLLAAPSTLSLGIFLGGCALQLTGDLAVLTHLRGAGLARNHVWLVFARPYLGVYLWARSLFTRRVVWRGNTRWLGAQTLILDEPPMRARLRSIRAFVAPR